MAEVIGIAVFVIGLLVSIALHEVGHMVPAKKFGVRVSQYFVGFGPTLWSRHGKETEYGVKAIPLGGYVRLVGMVPPEDKVKPLKVRGRIGDLIEDARAVSVEEIHEGEDHRAFYHLAWWKKVIVMFGGPFVNLVIAAVLFTIVLSGIGFAGAGTLTIDRLGECVPVKASAECAPGDPVSPSMMAGLRAGDTFVAVDGRPVETWADLTEYVSSRPGQEVVLTLDRDGEERVLPMTLAAVERPVVHDGQAVADDIAVNPEVETVGFMGVYPETTRVRQPLTSGVEATVLYTGLTAQIVVNLPSHLYHVVRASLGLEERNAEGVVGLVGVGRIAAENPDSGIVTWIARMLLLLGSLNLALFVFNMIPLVPLDGGHIASAVWQAIKNGWARLRGLAAPRPVDVARMMPLAYGVFGILILMGLVLIWADIVAPVTLG
ncbi:MAG: zinc metalloprotease [Actinobacteria bacterium HGW-Actinobacteria-4]|nr:MAG: zinc metalloprotease [Actinobacteria bacterium HGW-Actinobacteria-4]